MNRRETDPIPVLGEQQFLSVAKGFRKFDEYLIKTLGKSDTEIATRDQWRGSTLAVPTKSMQPPMTPPGSTYGSTYRPNVAPGAHEAVPADDSDSDSDSDEDSDDDEEEPEKGKGKGKSTAKEAAPASSGVTEVDMKQFEAFQRFMKMQSQQSS